MSNGLHKLCEELHNRILVDRSIENLITRRSFERLWNHSEDDQKEEVKKHVEERNKKNILKWMREHPSIDIGEKPLRDLYPIAKRLHIANYSRLLRDDLIIAIKKAEADNNATQQRSHVGRDPKKNLSDVGSSEILQSEGESSLNT